MKCISERDGCKSVRNKGGERITNSRGRACFIEWVDYELSVEQKHKSYRQKHGIQKANGVSLLLQKRV